MNHSYNFFLILQLFNFPIYKLLLLYKKTASSHFCLRNTISIFLERKHFFILKWLYANKTKKGATDVGNYKTEISAPNVFSTSIFIISILMMWCKKINLLFTFSWTYQFHWNRSTQWRCKKKKNKGCQALFCHGPFP